MSELISMLIIPDFRIMTTSRQVPRAYHAAAAYEGRIYVVGGMDSEGRRLGSAEWLDPREGWK